MTKRHPGRDAQGAEGTAKSRLGDATLLPPELPRAQRTAVAPPKQIHIATAIYNAVMLEIERLRHAMGISMDLMSELMGGAERAYAKMLYPDTASGRQARWETVQRALDVVCPNGFRVRIERANTGTLTPSGTKRLIQKSAKFFDRKAYLEEMRERARAGGLKGAATLNGKTSDRTKSSGEAAARLVKPGEEISYGGVPGISLAPLDLDGADAVERRANEPGTVRARERVLRFLSSSMGARLAVAEAAIAAARAERDGAPA